MLTVKQTNKKNPQEQCYKRRSHTVLITGEDFCGFPLRPIQLIAIMRLVITSKEDTNNRRSKLLIVTVFTGQKRGRKLKKGQKMCIWHRIQNWLFDLTSMSSSAALTSNPIYWLFSSSSLLTSTTKRSFLVLPHPENDHAALITEACQGIPSHHWQRNNIHLQLSVLPLRLATSGLRLGGGGSIRAIYRTLPISLPRGQHQQDWRGKRYREHPGPLRSSIRGLGLWPQILICAWVILECSSAMIYDRPAHLIFSVFVDLEHVVRQLVGLEAFAVKDKQTDVA